MKLFVSINPDQFMQSAEYTETFSVLSVPLVV